MNLTVTYHALDGQIFRVRNVVWYEMQEAFNECSRQAYIAGTEVDYVTVTSEDSTLQDRGIQSI